MEAMQEFAIQTSTYAPEFGRQPGGQISIVTRSGANEFHGSLFEYFRNDKLDANNWFANANNLPRNALRQNDFGAASADASSGTARSSSPRMNPCCCVNRL